MPAAVVFLLLSLAALAPSVAQATPQPPRDVYAEAPRADQVRLSWRPGVEPPPAPERYEVLRDGKPIAVTGDLKLTDSWLTEATGHSYVVRAIDPGGSGAESVPITIRTPPFQAGLELEPYLQQLTPTSATIIWQTYGLATTSLYFGPAGGADVNVARREELRRDHEVTMSGLTPDTVYSYRWESDGRIGPPAEFRTPPASSPRFNFGVIGDFGVPTPAAKANLKRLSQDDIDLAITTGDNAQLHAAEHEYRDYVLEPLRDLIARRAFWPSVGNHDYENLHNYLRYFSLPPPERYYSFTHGGVLFLSLDSNRYDSAQKTWMRRVLQSPARCKVAFFHHPLWSSGRGYRNRVRKRRREKIAEILERGGVDLVLNGHVQNYERSKPLRRGRVNRRRGIVYVVTGGGGARLNPFVTKHRPRWSARRGVFHHRLRVIASGDRLSARAIDTGGNTRDRFTVRCR
jgi:hypothetical protein